VKQHGHLKRLYGSYRTKYFGSSIPEPENAKVSWDASINQDLLGDAEVQVVDGKSVACIRLNPLIRPFRSLYKMVLLHEMAHIKLWPWCHHGKKFDAEMLRLAAEGALKGLW